MSHWHTDAILRHGTGQDHQCGITVGRKEKNTKDWALSYFYIQRLEQREGSSKGVLKRTTCAVVGKPRACARGQSK